MIKTGGENVPSIKVERALLSHPAVANAAAIGLPHPRWFEAVTGVVTLKPGSHASEEDLLAALQSPPLGIRSTQSRALRRASSANRNRQDPENPVARAFRGFVRGVECRDAGRVCLNLGEFRRLRVTPGRQPGSTNGMFSSALVFPANLSYAPEVNLWPSATRVREGQFDMTTPAEIRQAVFEYRSGRFAATAATR